MTTTVVMGCSYGCGEWQDGAIVHGGLAQYLHEAGHSVVNLSGPGHALEWLLTPLKSFIVSNRHLQIKDLLLIQTDISRNFIDPTYKQNVIEFNRQQQSVKNTMDKFYKDFYLSLNAVLDLHNIKGYVFGGLTDVTTDLTDCNRLEIVVPSLCKMLSGDQSDQVRITEVQAWEAMDQIFDDNRAEILDMMELSEQRNNFFKQSSYFPDNYHPNRTVHQMLYNKLQAHKEMNV